MYIYVIMHYSWEDIRIKLFCKLHNSFDKINVYISVYTNEPRYLCIYKGIKRSMAHKTACRYWINSSIVQGVSTEFIVPTIILELDQFLLLSIVINENFIFSLFLYNICIHSSQRMANVVRELF